MKKEKLKSLIIFFFKIRKIFSLPVKKDIIIYQNINSHIFKTYFFKDDVTILDKNINLNIPVLIISFLKCAILKSWVPYYQTFIKLSKAKCVITFLYNDPDFYFLKKNNDEVYISIQNGILIGDQSWIKIDCKYIVDYNLCFGSHEKKQLEQLIESKFISIGSFKNNLYSINPKVKKNNYITFISQFKPNRAIKNFFEVENEIIPFLDKFCNENDYMLRICGASIDYADEENFFYSNLIKSNYIFLPRINDRSSYQYIDESEINISIDSTLGLESLARGHKTGFFMVREKKLNLLNWSINFTTDSSIKSGLFWCFNDHVEEYERILSYLTGIDSKTWKKQNSELISKIIVHNYNNSILRNILYKHNISHKK
tara:strand:- start:672 stop:1784 length:1113 start_codon:yes stop_codon:yes gene_type:complete